MSSGNRSVSRVGSTISLPILAAIMFGVLAIIASVWALRSHNDVESLERDVAELRASANASVFTLEPTEGAPGSVQGQVYISLSGSGVVIASNLPQPGDNEEFRLWYLQDDDSATSGGTLTVDANGQGFALIPGDAGSFTHIAISLESTDSDSPAGNFLLIAEVRSGRG